LGNVLRASRRKDRLDRAKSVEALHRIVTLFNRANVGHSGAGVKGSGKIGQLFGRADGIDFDAAVFEVAGPPRNAEFRGSLLNKVTKPDSLHTT
jgi:hypothetical protein